jgi:hypothetical protein
MEKYMSIHSIPDLVIKNANVITIDKNLPKAESFAANIQEQIPQPTELDLQGIREGLVGKDSITSYVTGHGQIEVMAAITPLYDQDKIIGTIVVEQTTNSILSLSNRMIEETISLSILAFLFGGGALFLFAFRISARIRKLRNQAAAALTDDGVALAEQNWSNQPWPHAGFSRKLKNQAGKLHDPQGTILGWLSVQQGDQ